MKFSERNGLVQRKIDILREEVSEELRNTIWSVLLVLKFTPSFCPNDSYFHSIEDNSYEISYFSWRLWFNLFQKPVDTRPEGTAKTFTVIRDYYFRTSWFEFYDFIEFCVDFYKKDVELVNAINHHLERHLSPFRIIDGLCVEVTNPMESELLENELSDEGFPYVQAHLKQALSLMSDRAKPDYRNSIKESISAVESIAKVIAQKPTAELGEALKAIEKEGKLHGAMKQAFLSLYGYTSDADGIRHALMDEPNLTASDAKFFLMSCTSFVNYLKSKIN